MTDLYYTLFFKSELDILGVILKCYALFFQNALGLLVINHSYVYPTQTVLHFQTHYNHKTHSVIWALGSEMYMPYEDPNLAYQNSRKLEVYDRKYRGKISLHSQYDLITFFSLARKII